MKDNNKTQIGDAQFKTLFSSLEREHPSQRLKIRIMEAIEALPEPIRATPLIPKWIWGVLAFVSAAGLVWVYVNPPEQGFLGKYSLSLDAWIPDFQAPAAVTWALIAMGVFMVIQILWYRQKLLEE